MCVLGTSVCEKASRRLGKVRFARKRAMLRSVEVYTSLLHSSTACFREIVQICHFTYDAARHTIWGMIQSFKCEETCRLFTKRKSKRWSDSQVVALRKLDQIEAATVLDDLRIPPGNRLEPLKQEREGQHSIRINDKWRICFVWQDDGPHNVEIVDYH